MSAQHLLTLTPCGSDHFVLHFCCCCCEFVFENSFHCLSHLHSVCVRACVCVRHAFLQLQNNPLQTLLIPSYLVCRFDLHLSRFYACVSVCDSYHLLWHVCVCVCVCVLHLPCVCICVCVCGTSFLLLDVCDCLCDLVHVHLLQKLRVLFSFPPSRDFYSS